MATKYRLVLKDSEKDSDWYKLMMETVEQARHFKKGSTFKLDEEDKKYLENSYPNYSFQTINLKEVIEKNNLDNPNHGMFGRRVERWGEYPELYWYSKNKAQERFSPIRLTADLKIIDGNHRLYALYNMGYKNAEVLVLKDTSINDSDFDYGTGDVKGSDIFDITTTGTVGSYEDLLKGRDREYYTNRKNLKAKIVQMTPREYYRKCAELFRRMNGSTSTEANLVSQRRKDMGPNYINELKDVILKKKKKFPITVLDISHEGGQEGLHRMLVAGELFGWDTKFPVLLIETYDKEKQKRIEHNSAQREFDKFMEKLIRGFRYYEFYDLDEFCTMLADRIYDEYEQSPILSENKDNTLQVMIDCEEIDDALVYTIDLNEINIGNDDIDIDTDIKEE